MANICKQPDDSRAFMEKIGEMLGCKTAKQLVMELGGPSKAVYSALGGSRPVGPALLCRISERLDISVKKLKEMM